MELLQQIYLMILSPVTKITGYFNNKIRKVIITAICFCLVGYFVIYFNPLFHIRFRLTFDHVVCSFLLFILVIASAYRPLKRIKWNRFIFWTFFLSGLGIILISFIHPVGSGYRAFALMMMFGFPCLYFVWNNRGDYQVLYNRLSLATALTTIIYYLYCFHLAERGLIRIVYNRVEGRFSDPNMFSMLGMIAVCAALYMLLVNRGSWLWFAISALSLGTGLSIVKLGVSRLAILVVIGSMIAFSIYYIKTQATFIEANKPISKLIRAWLLLITVIVFLLSGNLMLSINNRAMNEHTVTALSEAAETTAELSNNEETPHVENDEEETNAANTNFSERFSTEGQDINTYTAGRYHIWKGYAQYLNLLGNDFSKADWDVLTNNTVKHAHNNFLEIAYRCGVPVACLHTTLEFAAGIICLMWLFGKKYKDPVYFFSITYMICYTVQSLFDIATLPFERPAPFYFYMAMIPIFMFGSKPDEEQKIIKAEAVNE